MVDLSQSLQGRDLGSLRILAELWGIEFSAPDARIGLQRLLPVLLDRELLVDVVNGLPEIAQFALTELMRNEGRMNWSQFERRFGGVREMGPARRDRERPYLGSRASPAEALWYRGLIGRAFVDLPGGPEELAFVPEDLVTLMPPIDSPHNEPLGRLATPAEKAYILPANDHILDDACTYLAAQRIGLVNLPAMNGGNGDLADCKHWIVVDRSATPYPLTVAALDALLTAAGLLGEAGKPQPEPVRKFLEASRSEALLLLFRAWMRASSFNDLCLTPSLEADGSWTNDPIKARRAVLDGLFTIPGGYEGRHSGRENPFWSLSAFVASMRQTDPDFQRSAGEYDSWYLRDRSSGENLRGFERWDRVDGELIRFMIAGPLHWLGVVDLGLPNAPEGGERVPVTAFRFTRWAAKLLDLGLPEGLDAEGQRIQTGSDGRIRVARLSKRSLRYQVARFAVWEKLSQDLFVYRITPASLESAQQGGLKVSQLIAFLQRSAAPLPPSLIEALENWGENGSRARIDRVVVLRVKSPELLQTLRESRVARYLGEPLGPTAIIVRPGAVDKLLDGLVELGYLGDARLLPSD